MKKSIVFYLLSFVIVAIAFPVMCFAQKAYVTTKYQGISNKLTVTLNVADGYFSGNEIKLYNKASRNTSRFLPEKDGVDETKPTKFYHFSPTGKKFTDYFLVDSLQENYEEMPKQFIAKYFIRSNSLKLVLKRKG